MNKKIASMNLDGVTYDVIQSKENFTQECSKDCDYYVHCVGRCKIREITTNFQYCKLKIR
jgi:hypothetical protein